MNADRQTGAAMRQPGRGGPLLREVVATAVIVGVLLAVLWPVLAGSRRAARAELCALNMKQLGYALQLYAHDHGDWYPVTNTDNYGHRNGYGKRYPHADRNQHAHSNGHIDTDSYIHRDGYGKRYLYAFICLPAHNP